MVLGAEPFYRFVAGFKGLVDSVGVSVHLAITVRPRSIDARFPALKNSVEFGRWDGGNFCGGC